MSVLAVVGTAVSILVALPQVWRTSVQGVTAGLARGHVWLAVVTAGTWTHYGLMSGETAAAASAAVGALLNAVLLLGLFRATPHAVARESAVVVPVAAVWLAAHAALVERGELAVVGSLTALLGVAAQAPQVLHMLRRPDLDLSGISTAAWHLSAVTALCWAGYWVLAREGLMVLPSLVGVLAAAGVLALLTGARAGRPHPAERFPRLAVAPRRAVALREAARVVVPGGPRRADGSPSRPPSPRLPVPRPTAPGPTAPPVPATGGSARRTAGTARRSLRRRDSRRPARV